MIIFLERSSHHHFSQLITIQTHIFLYRLFSSHHTIVTSSGDDFSLIYTDQSQDFPVSSSVYNKAAPLRLNHY